MALLERAAKVAGGFGDIPVRFWEVQEPAWGGALAGRGCQVP